MLSWREEKKLKSHGRGRAQLSGNCTEPNHGHVASVGLLSMEGMVGARDYD